MRIAFSDGAAGQLDTVTGGLTITNGTTVEHVVVDHSLLQAANSGVFNDADGAFFFARQLEHIKARSYDVKYANLKARQLFPVSNEGGRGVTTITYRTYDQAGSAKIINAYADDLPRADVSGKETTIPVRSVGTSYGYNIDEIDAAQLTGAPLEQRRANASRRDVEQVTNDVAFFGDATSGLPGLFSNPNVPIGPVVDPGSGTEWVNKTPDEILFDINELFSDIYETTLMVEQGNTLLLPVANWLLITTTARSINSDTTIAEFVVRNSPFLNSVDDLIPLNECSPDHNPTLTENAMVAYDRSPDKLQLEIPVELEYMAVQHKNLEFVVPGRSRLAGLNIYYPLSLAIAVGI